MVMKYEFVTNYKKLITLWRRKIKFRRQLYTKIKVLEGKSWQKTYIIYGNKIFRL